MIDVHHNVFYDYNVKRLQIENIFVHAAAKSQCRF